MFPLAFCNFLLNSKSKVAVAFPLFFTLKVCYSFRNCYTFLQASMDLPPDKAKLLKNYDSEKKWDIICDQVCFKIFINFLFLLRQKNA